MRKKRQASAISRCKVNFVWRRFRRGWASEAMSLLTKNPKSWHSFGLLISTKSASNKVLLKAQNRGSLALLAHVKKSLFCWDSIEKYLTRRKNASHKKAVLAPSHVTFLNCYKHLSNRKGEIQEKFKINSKIIIETN